MLFWLRSISAKHLSTYRYGLLTCCFILVGLVLRMILILQNWPISNSDEATMNLEALHIAYRGEHPIFLYGQNYMGALEAYVGAFAFRLFGVSVITMRLSMLPFFVLFLGCIYWLTCKIYTKKWAMLVVAFLSLGSSWVFSLQLEETGRHPEIDGLLALLFLLSCQLALSAQHGRLRWRLLQYTLWGVVAGVILWCDLVIAPYLLGAGLLLAVWSWRGLVRGGILCVLSGMLLGSWPLISYNLTARPGQDSISVFLALNQMNDSHTTFMQHILGSLVISLPAATGFSIDGFVRYLPIRPIPHNIHTLNAIIFQATWGFGFMILCCSAFLLATLALWQLLHSTKPARWTNPERQEAIRQFARLMLLFSALLTLAFYIHGPVGTSAPYTNSRYLIGLMISTPAVLWPLWNGLTLRKIKFPLKIEQALFLLRMSILLCIFFFLVKDSLDVFSEIPAAQATIQTDQTLSTTLDRLGIKHFYTEYWTCYRLIFTTRERLICSNLNNNLKPYGNRYYSYRVAVHSDPNPSYVFPLTAPQNKLLEALLRSSHIAYQRIEVAGYVIYKLTSPLKLPI